MIPRRWRRLRSRSPPAFEYHASASASGLPFWFENRRPRGSDDDSRHHRCHQARHCRRSGDKWLYANSSDRAFGTLGRIAVTLTSNISASAPLVPRDCARSYSPTITRPLRTSASTGIVAVIGERFCRRRRRSFPCCATSPRNTWGASDAGVGELAMSAACQAIGVGSEIRCAVGSCTTTSNRRSVGDGRQGLPS